MKKILLLFVLPLIILPTKAQHQTGPDELKHRRVHRDIENSNLLHRQAYHPGKSHTFHHQKASGHLNVLDSLVFTVYNQANSSWDPDFKSYYSFNDSGLITSYREVEWNNASSSWDSVDLELYEYDEAGNMIIFTDFDPSESGTDWEVDYMIVYAYEDGRLTESVESEMDNSDESLYPIWRIVYQYDENGRVRGTLEYIYTIGWQESWRTESVYDEAGNLISYIDFDDNEDLSSGWEFAWKEEFSYNDEEHLSLYLESEWDPDSEQWLPSDREEYTILSNGDVESYTDFDWDEGTGEWVPSFKGEYTYNPAINYEELALPWFFHDDIPNFFNHMMTNFTNYDYEGENWVMDSKGDYHFTLSGSTDITSEEREPLILFPNPASSVLYLPSGPESDIQRVEVYNLAGKMVLSENVTHRRSIRVDKLNKGMYLFRLINSENRIITSEKVILK